MSINSLSNQYMSSSVASIMQYSSSGDMYTGLGVRITNINIVVTGSLSGTASYALNVSSSVTVGGSDSQIQFNSGSTFRGDAGLTYNLAKKSLSHGLNVTASGTYSHAEGSGSIASGLYSHAEGWATIASGTYSHAEGSGSIASGKAAHAEGFLSVANADFAHAEGLSCTASGSYSHAEGGQCRSYAGYAHAEGLLTIASGTAAHAEGQSTLASGAAAHAEGANTIASGLGSHAEGFGSTSSGIYSKAIGYQSIAYGTASFSSGRSTIASGSYQTVVGVYNKPLNSSALFIVGNGNSGSRSDAFTVTPSGSITLPVTQSAAPSWTGTEGEMTFSVFGGKYLIYVYLAGAWRSGSLA